MDHRDRCHVVDAFESHPVFVGIEHAAVEDAGVGDGRDVPRRAQLDQG
jgi:hypothetical protein